jgi:hypothetical protein
VEFKFVMRALDEGAVEQGQNSGESFVAAVFGVKKNNMTNFIGFIAFSLTVLDHNQWGLGTYPSTAMFRVA